MHATSIAKVVLACAAVATPLGGQTPAPRPAKLIGLVRAEGTREAIIGAEIQIVSGPGALSNLRGVFVVDSITPGDRRLIIKKIGYAPLEITWPFVAGDSVIKIFELSTIQTLDSVLTVEKQTTDPRMAEFEAHRKLGMGKFYTKEDIARAGGHISNLMASTEGVRLKYGASGEAYVMSSRGMKSIDEMLNPAKHPPCYAEVYLDDALLFTRRTGNSNVAPPPPFDINSIPTSSIRAIEYYSGVDRIPPKYMKMSTECGVIVIHTVR
jgi:hypothetical protein